jgi:hypothetical protein
MATFIALVLLIALPVAAWYFGADSRPTDGRHNWAH